MLVVGTYMNKREATRVKKKGNAQKTHRRSLLIHENTHKGNMNGKEKKINIFLQIFTLF